MLTCIFLPQGQMHVQDAGIGILLHHGELPEGIVARELLLHLIGNDRLEGHIHCKGSVGSVNLPAADAERDAVAGVQGQRGVFSRQPAQYIRGDFKMVPHKEAHILACAVPDGLVKPLRHHVPVISGVFNGTADHRSLHRLAGPDHGHQHKYQGRQQHYLILSDYFSFHFDTSLLHLSAICKFISSPSVCPIVKK